jgi:hypothetical protein
VKKLIVLWVVLATSALGAGGDSLSFVFWNVDSAGNAGAALAADDSVFLFVYYPNGGLAYSDTNAYNGANLTATTIAGVSHYAWKDAVASLDGTTMNGVYSYALIVKDEAQLLVTPFRGSFTVYSATAGDITPRDVNVSTVSSDAIDLTTDICNVLADSNVATLDVTAPTVLVDSVNAILDTLQLHDGWVAKQTTLSADSVYGKNCLDSLQAQDGWIAKQTTLSADSVYSKNCLDSLQAQDGWIAKQTTLSADSIYGKNCLDSLQAQDGWIAKQTTLSADSIYGKNCLDSLQVQDGWIAKEASVAIVRDTTNAILASPGLDTSLFGYAEDVWTNIDTTTTIDTSKIGTWFISNVGTTAATDTSKIKTLVTNNTALFRNVSMISGDSATADALETMLDGTGGNTLSLGKLAVTGANGATGSVAITNTSGAAGVITSTSGAGLSVTGSTNGLVLVGGTGDALNATSTSGDGFDVTAGTNGTGVKFTGNGSGGGATIAAGISGTGMTVSAANGRSASFTGNYNNGGAVYMYNSGLTATNGLELASHTSSTGSALYIHGGTGISDISAEWDSANFSTPVYRAVWQMPFSTSFAAGSMADSLNNSSYVQGAASGLDSAKVVGAVINALNKDTTMHFKQIVIKNDGTATGDTAALAIYNTSASSGDHAMTVGGVAGAGIFASSTSNSAIRATTSGGSNPTLWVANTATGSSAGEAVKFDVSGTTNPNQAFEVSNTGIGVAMKVIADDSAAAVQIYNSNTSYATPTAGAGEGILVVSEHGNAATFQAGGTQATQGNYGLQVEGTTYLHGRTGDNEDAIQHVGTGTGLGAYYQSVSGTRGIRISGAAIDTPIWAPGVIYSQMDTLLKGGGSGSGSDTADIKTMFENNPTLVGSDTTAILALGENHPAVFYGPSGSGAGSGSYAVVIYAADTAGTDAVLADVKVTAQDAAGGIAGWDYTNSSGYVTLALDPATYTILARKIGYYWSNSTLVVSGNATDTAYGYDTETENVCRIYGYVKDVSGNGIEYATVTATMPGRVYDSCAATLVFDNSVQTTTTTDGYFELDLIRSSCLNDKAYKISWSKRDVGEYSKQFTVPDSTTYLITW